LQQGGSGFDLDYGYGRHNNRNLSQRRHTHNKSRAQSKNSDRDVWERFMSGTIVTNPIDVDDDHNFQFTNERAVTPTGNLKDPSNY
jgi:hypothetical protein